MTGSGLTTPAQRSERDDVESELIVLSSISWKPPSREDQHDNRELESALVARPGWTVRRLLVAAAGTWKGSAVVLVAVSLAVWMQFRLRDLGMPHADWKKYSASFAIEPLATGTNGPFVDGEARREGRRVWDPVRERKSILVPPYSQPETGTAFLFWLPGYALNFWLLDSPRLDLRLLAIPLRVALLAGIGAFAATAAGRARPRALALAPAAAITALFAVSNSDATFVAFLPSFMRESSTQISWIFLVTILALPAEVLVRRRGLLALATALLVASAPLHVVILFPILAAIAIGLPRRDATRVAVVLVPIALAAAVWSLSVVAERTARNGAFHAIYNGLLPHSADPAEQLRRLGLPEGSIERLGTRQFSANRDFVDENRTKLSIASVLCLVASEPVAAFRLWIEASRSLTEPPPMPGYWPRDAPQRALTWRDAPRTAFWDRVGWKSSGLAILGACLVLALAGCMRASTPEVGDWSRALLFVSLAGISELVGATLGDGVSDLARHLFLARLALDASVIIAALQVAVYLSRSRAERTSTEPSA